MLLTLRAALLALALAVALAHATGDAPQRWIHQLDRALADTRLRATLPGTLDKRIVIVAIDEKSLADEGRWPWPRARLAALTDALFERHQIAALGFDVVFAEPEPGDGDARLAAALAGRPVALGFYLNDGPDARRSGVLPAPVFDAALLQGHRASFTRWTGHAGNLALLAQAAPAAGFINALPDDDGVVRSVPLLAEVHGEHHETLALALLRRSIGSPAVAPVLPPAGLSRFGGGLVAVQLRQGGTPMNIPVDSQVAVRVPYRGPGGAAGGSFEHVSASDVLNGRLAAGSLAGKYVFLGATAPGLYDLRATPVDKVYPGVEVHANLLSGLLDDRLDHEPDWARGYEVVQLLAVALVLGLSLPRLGAGPGVATTLAVAAALLLVNLWFALVRHELLPLASALLLTAWVFVVTTSWGYIAEGHRRRSITRLFGAYVPPELVLQMARNPGAYTMQAENRELTVMFCDMRNFTRVSESLPPEELRGLVNRFFSTMTAAIRDQRGTLDKYIGDAIMAFWGAPVPDAGHAEHAVRAALAMVERLDPLNADLRSRGLPAIGLGIGLNTGLVCVGDMGSDIRRSYTVMGDAVNLASRIEALTRHYGVDILVGQGTRDAAGDACTWLEIDRVRVKGRSHPVTLFTPVAEAVSSTPRFADESRHWLLALASYRLQHWDEVRTRLAELGSRFPGSGFATLYRQLDERTVQFRVTPPPPGWDGAHTFESK